MPASNTLFLPPSARPTRRLRINLRPVMPISCHRHRKLAECTRYTTALAGTGFGCVAHWNPPMVRIDHDGAFGQGHRKVPNRRNDGLAHRWNVRPFGSD